MNRDITEFDAVCEDGRKFRITATGDFGRTHDNYLVRKENANYWKVIELGLLVRPVEKVEGFSTK